MSSYLHGWVLQNKAFFITISGQWGFFLFFEPLLNEELKASATIIMSEFTSTQGDLQGAKLQPIHRNCLPLYLEERFHTIFQGFDAIEKAYNASEVHNNNNKTDEHIERWSLGFAWSATTTKYWMGTNTKAMALRVLVPKDQEDASWEKLHTWSFFMRTNLDLHNAKLMKHTQFAIGALGMMMHIELLKHPLSNLYLPKR